MDMIRQHRFWVLWVGALAVLTWYFVTDPDRGAETLARLQWLAWLVVAGGPVYWLRRAFLDGARSRDAYLAAMQNPVGAGLVFIGLALLTGLLFIAFAGHAAAENLPAAAQKYLPLLTAEQRTHWPDMPLPSSLAAQVEQETCPSLSSRQCWNPHAELRTQREYGFGLGQLTVTARFDNFAQARKLHGSLRDWQWAERYDPARQLRAMILMDRSGFLRLLFVHDPRERLAMTYAAYNGGMGGLLSDRRLCTAVAGCDPGIWFGQVERHSLKARTRAAGYGQSFYAVNRGYVRAVMLERRPKYADAMKEKA